MAFFWYFSDNIASADGAGGADSLRPQKRNLFLVIQNFLKILSIAAKPLGLKVTTRRFVR